MYFGKTLSGQDVETFTLSNSRGTYLEVITLGAIIKRFCIALDNGTHRDIVLGFDSIEGYLNNEHYLGCVVGRYANRIDSGKLVISDLMYEVDVNQAGNCLHGGSDGFSHRIWDVHQVSSNQLCLSLISPDTDQGFPGELNVEVTYTLSEDDKLSVAYKATCDKTTTFNPTQHSYFNLDGHNAPSIKEHTLQISADHILQISSDGIPTGELKTVKGSDFDFNHEKCLEETLNSDDTLITQAHGLDHNWCLRKPSKDTVSAVLTSTNKDIEMQVTTTMPGLQVYSGNFLSPTSIGKDGNEYRQHQGICLETQFYPDSPNHPHFPTTLMTPDEVFVSETSYQIIVHQ